MKSVQRIYSPRMNTDKRGCAYWIIRVHPCSSVVNRSWAVGLVVIALFFAGCGKRTELSPQQIAQYSAHVSFSNFQLSAAENLAKHTIFYVDAVVKNDTGRAISFMQVRASFFDLDGQAVFREPAAVVKETQASLGAGQSREFRMAFEGIPDAWSRTAPQLEITRLVLQ